MYKEESGDASGPCPGYPVVIAAADLWERVCLGVGGTAGEGTHIFEHTTQTQG